jgi:hypothetical protein
MNIKKIKTRKVSLGNIDPKNPEKEVFLFYDMNALSEMEERDGSIAKAMAKLKSQKLKDIQRLLWYGVIHQYCELDDEGELVKYTITTREIGTWFGMSEVSEVSKAISLAFGAQIEDIEEMEKQAISISEEIRNNPAYANLGEDEIQSMIEKRLEAIKLKNK